MIIIKKLKWSNAFSYGEENEIDFSKYPILQILGMNGHGKTSIGMILQEVLYNKNSKGIKKANILNRNLNRSKYTIEVELSKFSDTYKVVTVRSSSTQTVTLYKNGENISGHTSTTTYKMIEDIMGMDHKAFCQIVNQSSAFSLEFLTATDTNRKKFLIDLLDLNRYIKAGEYFKRVTKEVTEEYDKVNAKVSYATTWLSKNKGADLSTRESTTIPEPNTEAINELEVVKSQLLNITAQNKKIVQNNKYIELSQTTKFDMLPAPTSDLVDIRTKLREATKLFNDNNAIIKGTGPIYTKCPTCGQDVDNSHKEIMLLEAKAKATELAGKVTALDATLKAAEAEHAKFNKNKDAQQEWERYIALIDNSCRKELFDENTLKAKILELDKAIKDRNLEISKAVKFNAEVAEHNASVKVISSQIKSTEEELAKATEAAKLLSDRLNTLQILNKTFSPSGLVAYKIEIMIKDLENSTNKYLQEISDGRFQITFKVAANDKLDVIINDSGEDIEITALSNGELAKVNMACLLSIRKIMQDLSDSRINLLILDETIGYLDDEAKDRLIELLLQEDHLNTVLISHAFTHPLLEKITAIKRDGISRLE